jgi:tetratricopeptide (TPR) repeat protein
VTPRRRRPGSSEGGGAGGSQWARVERVNAGRDVYQWVVQFIGARPSFAVPLLAAAEAVPAGAGPSGLLVARREVVPFIGREEDRARLEAWLEGDAVSAAHLVTGRGGQGKTRLALQVARDAQDRDWVVLSARHRFDGGTLVQAARGGADAESLHLDRCAGVLLLVDYADRWPRADLLQLLEDPRLHTASGQVRVLLLARSGQFWVSVGDLLRTVGMETSQALLQPLPESLAEREAVFSAAVRAFAMPERVAAGGVEAGRVIRPASLAGEAFALMLSLQMAALVAVLAAADGLPTTRAQRLVDDPAQASRHLIRREVRHWVRMRDPDVLEPVSCSTAVMARAVFVATLTRGLVDRDAADLLDRLQGGDRAGMGATTRTILDDHRRCYPPADPAHSLEPLLPDRLGEDFLAAMLPGAPDDRQDADSLAELADPVAADLLVRLLRLPASEPDPGSGAGSEKGEDTAPVRHLLTRPVLTTLVETARRWNHVATGHLIPMLAEAPDLALAGGGSTLARLCDVGGIETVLPRVGDAANKMTGVGFHLEFDPGAALVAERLVAAARVGDDDSDLAIKLDAYSSRLARLGRWEEALFASEEAVTIFRALADADPEVSLPDLAMSLNNLSNRLSDLGRPEEALVPIEEAVTAYRALADADPDAFLPDLATSLINLAASLAGLGWREQALPPSEEAVTTIRALADARPEAFLSNLASSLDNLSLRLGELGRRPEEALAASEEAVTIFRALADARPEVFLPDLGASLNNLSNRLGDLGRREEALAAIEEVVTAFRALADARPEVFLPELATSLNNLAGRLSILGRWGEALAAMEEAITTYQDLADARPDVFGVALDRALRARAWLLGHTDHS